MILASTMLMATALTSVPSNRDQRREAFVAAARAAFFEHGYASTTMSAISAQVGGSKTTLWSFFPSKQDLFIAVVDDIVEQYGCALALELCPDLPVEEGLERFAAGMLSKMLSPPIISLHRVVTGEAGRFPELGRLFYERGPIRGRERLSAYIAKAMSEGMLRAGDPELAARQFASMCQANSFQRALYGLEIPLPESVARDITSAVDSFLRAWGPDTI
ncbi:TetR/AcrR family transcriptional regulator [soil metagenome]